MNLWQNYVRPKNLSEAMDAFAHAPRPLLPIAGGTDLLLDLEQGRHSPVQTLVDVTSIAEMTLLEIRGDELYIGASVPVNRVATTPEVAHHAQALTEACNLIAGPQVRNVATLGGNVAHALPAADGTIALLALDAKAEIIGWAGLQYLPELDETEVGFLLDRPFWGKGYATEAALASLRFGFEHCELDHTIALVHPENHASRRVIEKCGLEVVDSLMLWGIELMRFQVNKEDFH